MTNYNNYEGNSGYNFELFEDNKKRADEYDARAKKTIDNSTGLSITKERANVSKQQYSKQDNSIRRRALLLACLVIGGVASLKAADVVESMKENEIVRNEVIDFSREVISPNTHRTLDGQNYYYEYDDIAEHINEDGKDFSSELYKTYANIGEYQTNRVMEYTNFDSVEDYTTHAGFDSIESWEESERKKILLQNELTEKQSELDLMYSELNTASAVNSVDNYGGGVK